MMFRIRNIKISLKVKPIVLNNAIIKLQNKGIIVNTYSNFLTFKADNYTYVVFKKGHTKHTHINITQIPSIKSIRRAIEIVKKCLECKVINYKTDNIIATSDLRKPICLIDIINKKCFEKIKYNNEIFPGLFIKFSTGTVIIFHSGKIVIVGCKNQKSIQWIIETVHANI